MPSAATLRPASGRSAELRSLSDTWRTSAASPRGEPRQLEPVRWRARVRAGRRHDAELHHLPCRRRIGGGLRAAGERRVRTEVEEDELGAGADAAEIHDHVRALGRSEQEGSALHREGRNPPSEPICQNGRPLSIFRIKNREALPFRMRKRYRRCSTSR